MNRSTGVMSHLYRIIVAAVIVVILALPVAAASKDVKFVGSKKSNKYHYTWCRWAKKIHLGNAIYFDSVKEARDAGYVPCKVCRPPSD